MKTGPTEKPWTQILRQAEEENHRERPDADRTLRMAATMADLLLFILSYSVVVKVIGATELAFASGEPGPFVATGLRGAALIGLAILYFATTTSHWGGTLGKRLLGIRVTTPEGQKIGFWKSVVREILLKYALGIITAGIVPMLYISGGHKRPIHDEFLNTTVKRVRGR